MSQYRGYFVPWAMDPNGLASRDQIENSTLQYSCNCGWIDWNHAGDKAKDVAKNLFNDVWNSINGANVQMGTGTRVVCYQQTQSKLGASTGYRKCYWIKEGMTAQQKRSVAWSIFKEVSEKFEEHQSWVGNPWNNSGFSPEDLISDLLLFQRVTTGVTRAQIEQLCGVIKGKQDNYDLFDAFDWSKRAIRSEPPGSPWKALTFVRCNQCPPKKPAFPNSLLPPISFNEGNLYGGIDRGTTFYNLPKVPDVQMPGSSIIP